MNFASLDFQLGNALSLEDLVKIPDDVLDSMLSAGADVGKAALEQSIRDNGLVDTGIFVKSLKKRKKTDKSGRPYYLVYPTGKRKYKISYVGKRKKRIPKKTVTSNAVIGMVYEYGSARRGITARQWARTAVEKSADSVLEAELKKYDEYLNE